MPTRRRAPLPWSSNPSAKAPATWWPCDPVTPSATSSGPLGPRHGIDRNRPRPLHRRRRGHRRGSSHCPGIAIAVASSVCSIIGGRSKEWVIFEPELRRLGEVVVCTDDGSLRPERFCHGCGKGNSCRRRRQYCLCRRAGTDDARGGEPHEASRSADHRVPEPGDDRRHRHVRRLPGDGGQ